MVLIHKFFKIHPLNIETSYLLIAASSVFLTCKVLYCPISLENVAHAFFHIEKRQNPSQLKRTGLSDERKESYKKKIE